MKRMSGLLFIFSFLMFFLIQVPVKADIACPEDTSEAEQEAGTDTYITVDGSDCDLVIRRESYEVTDGDQSRYGTTGMTLLETLADCELGGEYSTVGDIPEKDILSVEETDNMVIITYIIPNDKQERVTSRNIVVNSTVIIDRVEAFTLCREIEFAYGIPYNGAHGAQIISVDAYISYVNSGSTYYPDTSSIAATIGNMGNPAICTTTVNVYIKSSDQLHGRYVSEVYCYGDGDWK